MAAASCLPCPPSTPHLTSTSLLVLQDWNDGRIPYFTSPPSRGNEEFASAEVVGAWAKDFDAEAVFATEKNAVIAHLPSMDQEDGERAAGGSGAFFQMESVGGAKVDLAAMELDEGAEDDDGAMDEDDDEEAPAPVPSKRITTAAVAATLYAEAGQFNPHAARADRKKRTKKDPEHEQAVAAAKARKQQQKDADEAAEEDFEFEEAAEEGSGGKDGMESD